MSAQTSPQEHKHSVISVVAYSTTLFSNKVSWWVTENAMEIQLTFHAEKRVCVCVFVSSVGDEK